MTALRTYQLRALAEARAHYAAGKRAVLIVAPTGSGKTIIGSAAAHSHRERKGQVVWLAHRIELVRQAVDKLIRSGIPHADIGAIAANGGFNERAPVLVCSIQTLLARDIRPQASLLIPDEAHHYLAADWNRLAQFYRGVPVFGLTATPMRADGTGLLGMFDCLVVAASNRELVAEGHLVPCEVVGPSTRLQGTDLVNPVEAIRKHAGDRPTVVFASSIGYGKMIAAELGDRARFIDGSTGSVERAEAIRAFEAGRVQVLVNVFILTEGWDCPRAEVCVIARGCSSAGTYLQMIGRIRRPFEGKSSSLLIDCKGAVYQHGLPDDDREFSLSGAPIRVSDKLPAIRQCPQCAAVFRIAPTCFRCGYLFPKVEAPTIKKAELREVDYVTPERDKRGFLRQQLAKARELGHKPGWAAFRFKWRFGTWPPSSWLREEQR